MRDTGQPAAARSGKRASAFRTIGEVADDLDLPPHVLRFWESKFPQLQPLKRGGGRRYYRPEDILLLRRIQQCLYQDGYTIRGVQKLLGDAPGVAAPTHHGMQTASLFPLETAPDEAPDAPLPARRPRRRPTNPAAIDPDTRAALEEVRRELLEARALLTEILRRQKKP